MNRSIRRLAGPLVAALFLSLFLWTPAPLLAGGREVSTRTALLVGFPDSAAAAAEGVLVVPGTVIALDSATRTATGLREEGERSHRLAEVARSLERTLRLGRVDVSYTLDPVLAVGETKQLPPPSLASTLRITVELLGASAESATYRVAFAEGSRPLTDSRVAIRRGERAVVGGVDGPEAPYLFLVLEPRAADAGEGAEPRAVDAAVTPPVRVYAPPPAYTSEGRAQRIQGVVILQATIDETGAVTGVQPLKGLPMGLTESAVEAVRQWRFEPARDAAGKPISVYYNLAINFRMDESEKQGAAAP